MVARCFGLCWDIFVHVTSVAFECLLLCFLQHLVTGVDQLSWINPLAFPLNKLVLSLFQRQRQCLLSPYRWGRRWGRHWFSALGFQRAHSQVWLQHAGAGWEVLFPGPGSQTVALCPHVSMGAACPHHPETSGCPCHLRAFVLYFSSPEFSVIWGAHIFVALYRCCPGLCSVTGLIEKYMLLAAARWAHHCESKPAERKIGLLHTISMENIELLRSH